MTNNKQIVLVRSNKRKLVEYEQGKRKKQKSQYAGNSISRVTPPIGGTIVFRSGKPRINTYGDEVVRVCNTEIFNNIPGTVTAGLAMSQPFIPSVVPWLSGIAVNFSKYRWLFCRLIYVPTCPTTTAGAITMGISYDLLDLTPTTRVQLAQMRDSTSSPVWAGWEGSDLLTGPIRNKPPAGAVYCDLDVSKVTQPWYRIVGGTNFLALSPSDRNQVCPAQAYAVTDGGIAASLGGGSVYIAYEIEFIEPVAIASNI